jgi:hypothetical protein
LLAGGGAAGDGAAGDGAAGDGDGLSDPPVDELGAAPSPELPALPLEPAAGRFPPVTLVELLDLESVL